MSQKQPTQAKALFDDVASAAASSLAEGLGAKMEGVNDEKELARAFGVELSMDSPADLELLAVRLATSQISAILDSSLTVSPIEARERGGDARPQTTVVVERAPEAILARYFKAIDPALLTQTLGKPGAIESISAESTRFEINFFADGSMISLAERSANPNAKLYGDICALASSPAQLAMDEPEKVQKIEAQFAELRERVESDMGQLSAEARRQLPGIFQEAIIGLFKTISQKSSMSIPHDNVADMMKVFDNHQDPAGSWAPGVSVSVNGSPCPDPASLARELGAQAPLTLESAMERLRQSREPQAPASPKRGARR